MCRTTAQRLPSTWTGNRSQSYSIPDDRWTKNFERTSRQAREGKQIPALLDLLSGAPFLAGDIQTDVQHFLAGMDRIWTNRQTGTNPARAILDRVEAIESRDDFYTVSGDLGQILAEQPEQDRKYWSEAAARFEFYAASRNCLRSNLLTAARSIAYACDDTLPQSAKRQLIERALKRLIMAGWECFDVKDSFGPRGTRGPPSIETLTSIVVEALIYDSRTNDAAQNRS